MNRLDEHAKLVGFENVDEFTFRSFVLAEIKRFRPGAKCQIEWSYYDLMVWTSKTLNLIEFKFFYGPGRSLSLDKPKLGAWKGGPSAQNAKEFKECVDKLLACETQNAVRYLVLVYRRRSNKPKGKLSYQQFYDDLSQYGFADAITINHSDDEDVTCKLIVIS